MPTYEFRCSNGHSFEVILSMSDDPITACEECGAPVERVFHPVAVHFKGSGFYSTDYADKAKSGAADSKDGDSSASKDSDSGSSSDSKQKSSDSKENSSGSSDSATSKAGSNSG